MFKKRLSQVLWAIWKWFVVDTLDGKFPIRQEVWIPTLAWVDDILAATAMPASWVTVVTAGITDPDVLRTVSITWNAAGIVWNVIIKWLDWAGRSVVEIIVADATNTVVGNIAFRTIHSVELPVQNAWWDTISVWISGKIGLYRDIELAGDVLSVYVNWTREAIASVDTTYNTVTVTSAFDGIKRIEVSYLVTTF